jgi:nucleotide-binding universal stress UspA family protein
MKLSALIVPVDGSVLAETAVYRAVDLARETGARVLLLRAVEAPSILRAFVQSAHELAGTRR